MSAAHREVTLASDDSELIASYLASGCRDSLDQLLERYLGRTRRLIFQMVLEDEAADELTQEVMLKAIRGLAGFNNQAAFATWLHRIAINTTYSFLAARKRSRARSSIEKLEVPTSAGNSPERAAMYAELDHQVALALGQLSPKLRAAIVLTALQDMSPAEAAAIEGCSAATMYWRVHQARKQLHDQLEKWL